ncbi:MAG TPA: IS1595 family transposase [Allosphingosinicella sp.]
MEALHWPNGPVCPHCGEDERVTRLTAATARAGLHKCNACRKQFTVTVGTIFEDSKIGLNKWLLGFRLMAGSKKGVSAHQLHRSLGITYKSAWFMGHRIREAMNIEGGPLGGPDTVVEADETYVGGKARNRAFRAPAPKKAVVALVERDGRVASQHVANVTAANVRPLVVSKVERASYLMTDESMIYTRMGREFSGHGTVNHSAGEYVRTAGFHHTNTVENFFSIFKRGVIGTYHHMSEAHLGRYCAEFDFRYNTRAIGDTERTDAAVIAARGKRLTYRRPLAA